MRHVWERLFTFLLGCCVTSVLFVNIFGSVDERLFSSVHQQQQQKQQQLDESSLNVPIPFFLYSGEEWDIFTRCNTSRAATKHSAEALFTRSLESHPWRTTDPSKALIFVAPLWFGHAHDHACELPVGAYLEHATKVLKESKHYKARKGSDHLVYIPSHKVPALGWRFNTRSHDSWQPLRHFVFASNDAHPVQDRIKGYCPILVPFPNGRSTDPISEDEVKQRSQSAKEYRARPINFAFIGQADKRRAYADRRFAIDKLSSKLSPSYFIESPPYSRYNNTRRVPCDEEANVIENCKIHLISPGDLTSWRLGRSKFGLFFRGDLPGSQRLSQLGRVGTLPVLISDATWDQFLPFHCQIPWKKIVYRSTVRDFREDPIGTLKKMSDEDESAFAERLALFQKHIPDFVWEVPNTRVPQNILRTAVQHCQTEKDVLVRGFDKLSMACVEGHYDFAFGG